MFLGGNESQYICRVKTNSHSLSGGQFTTHLLTLRGTSSTPTAVWWWKALYQHRPSSVWDPGKGSLFRVASWANAQDNGQGVPNLPPLRSSIQLPAIRKIYNNYFSRLVTGFITMVVFKCILRSSSNSPPTSPRFNGGTAKWDRSRYYTTECF